MNAAEINFDFDNRHLRIDKMFWLAASLQESLPDKLKELFTEEDYSDLSEMFGLPVDEMKDENWDEHFIKEWLLDHRKFGFVIQAATPVRTYFAKNSYQMSWGNYYTKWLYAESFEEVIELAKKWGDERRISNFKEMKKVGAA